MGLIKRLTWVSWTFFVVLALSGVYGAQQQISSGQQHVICDSGCAGGNPNGQATMANSSPVVLASNQSSIPVTLASAPTTAVTGTFWQATQPVSLATAPALVGSVANIGIVRAVPSSCTQSLNFAPAPTVGVATGAGTSVTSTTTCVTFAFVNNITNAAVTLRLQDKTGTPIIWLGGNADFSIQANSNMRIPLEGVIFTGGITAIAGTASALNLQVNGLQ